MILESELSRRLYCCKELIKVRHGTGFGWDGVFFIAAQITLCCGFMTKPVWVTQRCFSYF